MGNIGNAIAATEKRGRRFAELAARVTALLSPIDAERVEELLRDHSQIEAAVRRGFFSLPGIFTFEVDYGMSLEEMIVAGNFDRHDSNITTQRFPVVGSGVVRYEAMLFNPIGEISSSSADFQIRALDSINSWESGGIEHVIAFGREFPEELKKYTIIALGSRALIGDHQLVPGFSRCPSRRDLVLHQMYGVWGSICRFLAVRKISRL